MLSRLLMNTSILGRVPIGARYQVWVLLPLNLKDIIGFDGGDAAPTAVCGKGQC